MKSTLLTLMVLAHLIVVVLRPEAPKAIPIVGLSESSIKEQVKNEQRAKRYTKAARQAESVYRANGCSVKYAAITGIVATDYGLSPRLLAALVFVESTCNPNAVSGRDSVGLTQVNPRVWGRKNLKDPEHNLRIGASILAEYIRLFGLVEGLHHYNGYSDVHGHEYVNRILEVAHGNS
jgi:soluble lytic murein transglycosylase-like protein